MSEIIEVVEEFVPKQELAELKAFVVYQFEDKEAGAECVSKLTEEALLEGVFKPCDKYDAIKIGYSPFHGEDDNFTLVANGSTLFQITSQVKRPHGALVKRKCKETEAQFKKDNELEVLDKEQKALIKETVIRSLLPETTPDDPKTVLVWISGDKLIIGAQSYKKAEDFVDVVRSTAGSCAVKPLEVGVDVTDKLTEMLREHYDDKLVLMNLAHLVHDKQTGTIKYERDSLFNVDTSVHLKQGYKVQKMQMSYDLLLDFTVNDELEFTGLKVDKEFLSGAKDLAGLIITVGGVNKTVSEVENVFK